MHPFIEMTYAELLLDVIFTINLYFDLFVRSNLIKTMAECFIQYDATVPSYFNDNDNKCTHIVRSIRMNPLTENTSH